MSDHTAAARPTTSGTGPAAFTGGSSTSGTGPAASTGGSPTSGAGPRSRRHSGWRSLLAASGYLAPAVILLGVFVFYPLFRSIYLSLFETDFMAQPIFFMGLEQYRELVSSPRFWDSLKVTVLFTLYTVPTAIALAIPIALMGNLQIRGITFYRTIFISTIAVSTAIASVVWSWMFSPTVGVMNDLMRIIGLTPIRWLQDPDWALISVAITTVWKELGLNVLFLLAALQGVPEELYEAARIDGARGWTLFRSVTLPMISPTVFFLMVVGTMDAFRSFTQVHIMTEGGPLRSTSVLVYSIYRDAFINFRYGFASAQAVTLFLILLALTLIQFRVAERRVHYQ